MDEQQLQKIRGLLESRRKTFRWSAFKWKMGFRFLLITSAICSSASALVGKTGFAWLKEQSSDWAALLAALAAVLTTVIASLDFEINWRINRKARHEVEILLLELEKCGNEKLDKVTGELQDIVRSRIMELQKGD